MSRSGYHDWEHRPPSDRALQDAWLTGKIKDIWAENRQVYGAPRIHAELRLRYGIRVGRKRVERLMRQAGISGLIARKRGRTTTRVPGVRVADDLVQREFRPEAPDVLWIADITYLTTWEGWLYLAAVQDAFFRRIVGHCERIDDELVANVVGHQPADCQPKRGKSSQRYRGSGQQLRRRLTVPIRPTGLISASSVRRGGRDSQLPCSPDLITPYLVTG